MSRLFPAPLISLSILVLWLVLNGSASLGHFILGGALAVIVPLATASLRPTPARIRRPWTVLGLVLRVGRDVLVSNLVVAKGVLSPRRNAKRGVFVRVPLTLRDPHGLAALAAIMCVIPGTVWSELSVDRSTLLLHVFEVDDEAAFIAHVQSHYEKPLMEIFE